MTKNFLTTTAVLIATILIGGNYCWAQVQEPTLLLTDTAPIVDTTLVKSLTTTAPLTIIDRTSLISPLGTATTVTPTDTATGSTTGTGTSTLGTPPSTNTSTTDTTTGGTTAATGTFVPSVTDTRTPATTTPGSTAPATGTFTPRIPPDVTVVTDVPADTTTEECPPINPLSGQNVECPKTEKVPVIPRVPYILLATPLLGVLLFWLVISLLSRQQVKLEQTYSKKHLSSHHRQNVKTAQTGLYREIVEFISSNLSSGTKLDPASLQKFSAKIELLGSAEMKTRHQELLTACQKGNRDLIKQSLKSYTAQIKKEL